MISGAKYETSVTDYNDEYQAVAISNVAPPLLRRNGFTNPYIMGYVTPETFPACFNFNVLKTYNDGKTVTFNPSITKSNNIGWGYCDLRDYDSTQYIEMLAIKNDNTIFDSRSNTAVSVPHVLNYCQMAHANTYANGMSVLIRGIIMPVADEPANDAICFPNSSGRLMSATVYVNNADYVNILNNGAKITFSVNFNGGAREFSFNDDDFNEYNVAKLYDSNDEYVMYTIVIGFSYATTCRFANGNTYSTTRIQPFYRMPLTSDNTANINTNIPAMFIPGSFYPSDKRFNVMWDDLSIVMYTDSLNVRGYMAGYHIGNYPYTLDTDEMVSIPGMTYNTQSVVFGKYIMDSAGYNTSPGYSIYRIYCQNKLRDGWNAYALYHKCVVQGVSYATADYFTYSGKFAVTIFDNNNTPTGNRERTDETVQTLYDHLQPWQKLDADIFVNEFNPADIPEYVPPGGLENIGDNVIRPSTLGIGGTNGFVTQYALRATDIQELGQILWTSVFDSDYWQNYMFSLALDTGSFSMSSLLSFFVSLKVYPFALLNVPSYSQIGKNMYVGTGIHALEFTNNLHTINNYCDYIPGGSCTVWSGYFFNDYRDYINATYTLYVPYCGTIELNPGDVVHNELTVQYAVDFATGGCVAYVDVLTQDGAQFTIAALPGQMGADVPLTATAAGAVASRFIGDAMKFGGLISGEVSGVAGGVASAMMGKTPSGGSGNVLSGMAGMVGGLPAAVGMDLAPGIAMQAANMIARGAVAAPMMSGGQGFASFGAPQTPYVQIRRGIYPDVTGLSTVCGSRGAGTYKIGDLSGFVQGDIKTDGLNCPENEKIQIRQLIAKGIYV